MPETIHNLDQYMSDLRQILAQGKKRIGILLGAGAPVGIKVDNDGKLADNGTPLIPAIEGLTKQVQDGLTDQEKLVLKEVLGTFKHTPNIEEILSKTRSLALVLRDTQHKFGIHNQDAFDKLGTSICNKIGSIVNPKLPSNTTAYNRLAGWIGGTDREFAVEIFTSNYDLLMEEALEMAKIPYFCGFSGSHEPFFDAATIANNDSLPSRWARLWKLHGSLGWGHNEREEFVSGKGRDHAEMIYPDHLKYDHIQKLPYTALFDRLRKFLMTPDTLLLSCGFSYKDAHISAVISEALAANPAARVFACQFQELEKENAAVALAAKRPNFSVYASDKAIISCVAGKWEPGKNNENKDWDNIRATFWGTRGDPKKLLLTLGDFSAFAHFFALSKSDQTYSSVPVNLNVQAL